MHAGLRNSRRCSAITDPPTPELDAVPKRSETRARVDVPLAAWQAALRAEPGKPSGMACFDAAGRELDAAFGRLPRR